MLEDAVMLTRIVDLVAKLTVGLFRSLPIPTGPRAYRPERYYMRGPGPQWHAKHDRFVG
jgi:hypothetical protein